MNTTIIITILLLYLMSPFANASNEQAPAPFQDCEHCPEMVEIPAGTAILGSETWEANRKKGEGAVRMASIGYRLAIAKTEITRGQFRAFVDETGFQTPDTGCNTWTYDRIMGFVKNHHWDNPGYPQNDKHPVVCISFEEANLYAKWLAKKTGKPYRLLSSTEFEYATRAGTRGPWFWGVDNKAACEYANIADTTYRTHFNYAPVFNCDDKYERTAPVASFKPNPWGLYDMLGNAWEWTEDCLHRDMSKVPTDGRAWLDEDNGECNRRTPRGGSWVSGTDWVRAAAQAADGASYHSHIMSFRVALPIR